MSDLLKDKEPKETYDRKNALKLAMESIDSSSDYVNSLLDKINETVNLFKLNQIEEANRKFADLVDFLDLYIQLMKLIHKVTEIKTTTEIQPGKTFYDLEIHLFSIIKALLPAKEANDIVMLSDLLEYELAENLVIWKVAAIPALKKLECFSKNL